MRIDLKRTLIATIFVCIFVTSVACYKLTNEPYIFDPRFGAQSIYDFDYSDPTHPFTAFYIKKGTDFSHAEGDYRILDQTLTLAGQNVTSVEWAFRPEKYLKVVQQAGGKITEAAFWISQPNPWSLENGTYVQMEMNDRNLANVFLDLSAGNFTWNLPQTWDIPGSNFAYPRNFAVVSISRENIDQLISQNTSALVRFKIVLEKGVSWNIDYVVLRLYNNLETLESPWWTQHIFELSSIYASIIILVSLVILWTRRNSLRSSTIGRAIRLIWNNIHGNYLVLLLFIVGISLRLLIALPRLSDWDINVYRYVCTLTYSYGLDTRTFLSMYGPIWHGILLAFYPLYLSFSSVGFPSFLQYFVIKLPLIVCDVSIAFLLFRIGSRLAGRRHAKILAAFWLLNPYAIWMSSVWGIVHVVPTMFGVLALERFVHGRLKSSGLALAAAAFSGFYPVVAFFLLPCFLISLYKSAGKVKTLEFANSFFLSSAIFVIPWPFSLAIFSNTLQGPGRVGFPALSYSFLMIPSWLWNYWSVSLLLSSSLLFGVYLTKKSNAQLGDCIAEHIFVSFLLFFLSYTLIFPTYILWSLPYLLAIYVLAHKVPLSYVLFFTAIPILWNSYWGSISWISGQGTEIFRDSLGLSFSLLCLLMIVRLVSSDTGKGQATVGQDYEAPVWTKISQGVAVVSCVLVVFARWIRLQGWFEFCDTILKPIFFAVSISLLVLTLIRELARNAIAKKALAPRKFQTVQCVLAALLMLMWSYNFLVILDQTIPFINDSFPIFARSPDDLYFSLILVLLLPTIVYDVLMVGERTHSSMVTLVVFLQLSYILTRHFYTYAATGMLALAIDLLVLLSVIFLVLLVTFYQSKSAVTGVTRS